MLEPQPAGKLWPMPCSIFRVLTISGTGWSNARSAEGHSGPYAKGCLLRHQLARQGGVTARARSQNSHHRRASEGRFAGRRPGEKGEVATPPAAACHEIPVAGAGFSRSKALARCGHGTSSRSDRLLPASRCRATRLSHAEVRGCGGDERPALRQASCPFPFPRTPLPIAQNPSVCVD